MAYTTTVLQQLQHLLPMSAFQRFVGQHDADKYTKRLKCRNQLTILLYAQSSGKDSLRDIQTGMHMWDSRWYHLGLQTVARSTLARANELRSYEIYEDLFYELLKKCEGISSIYAKQFSFTNALYALDATTIDLCLNIFPWAKFRTEKGAIKMHTQFNIRSQIPSFITVTDGKQADITEARDTVDLTKLPKHSILTFDRGYNDYRFFYDIHAGGHTFVTRIKSSAHVLALQELSITESGVLKDQRIGFVLDDALETYPDDLRLVTYYDKKNNKVYRFLTNNFELSAKTIADIYKARWQIELFFKWIKQHLRIKTFLGTSKNAVMTQIWIAMIYYLLIAWVKFQTKFKGSALDLTRMIGEILMQHISLIDMLRLTPQTLGRLKTRAGPTQESLF
jgi:hypothetical protein